MCLFEEDMINNIYKSMQYWNIYLFSRFRMWNNNGLNAMAINIIFSWPLTVLWTIWNSNQISGWERVARISHINVINFLNKHRSWILLAEGFTRLVHILYAMVDDTISLFKAALTLTITCCRLNFAHFWPSTYSS